MNGAVLAVTIYTVINLISFCMYAWDKHKAVEGKWRIRESTLLSLGFIGAIGAVLGMKCFHHKTQKPIFKLNYFFLFLHIVGIVALSYWYFIM